MVTLKLKIKENTVEKVLETLRSFPSDEIDIIYETQQFLDNLKYLENECKEIESGKAEFVSHENLEASLNEVISKYENRL